MEDFIYPLHVVKYFIVRRTEIENKSDFCNSIKEENSNSSHPYERLVWDQELLHEHPKWVKASRFLERQIRYCTYRQQSTKSLKSKMPAFCFTVAVKDSLRRSKLSDGVYLQQS